MKIQDILFLVVFIVLMIKRDSRIPAVFGIISLILSIPLFSFWIFFSAQRLTWYAGAFFLLSIIITMFNLGKKENAS